MPNPVDVTNYALYDGAANAQGIASLQRAADIGKIGAAASSGTKLFGIDPASILFSTVANLMMRRRNSKLKDWGPVVPQTPEGQANELYNYLQSTEAQTQQAGDTEGRDAQYQALYDQAAELGMTDMAGELAQSPYVTNYGANPVVAAQSAADTLLNQIKEFLPFYDQSQLVLNPVTGTGSIVFGTPPSGSPVIQAGNLPKSNTNVGITTGVPILDQAINSVLNKPGGLESGSIRDEVIKIISEQAGLDPATTATILGKDLETILANANTDAANTASRFGIDLTGEKDGVVRNTGSLTSADLGEDTTVKGGGTDVVKTGAADSPIVTGAADAVDIVTGAGDSVIKTGSLTPADLGEDTTVKTGGGGSAITTGGGGGGGGGTATPATPLYGQGIRSMKTEKAGVTPLEDVFDIGDMSLANVLRLLTGEDDNTQGTPYYGGGSVNRANSVDELIRLLRG
jgi:hypothetical protein